MFKKNKTKGFTLIELLVVVAIVGLLATMIAISLENSRKKSRDAKRKGDLRQIYTALGLYQSGSGNGQYPSTGGDWECFTGVDSGSLDVLVSPSNLMARLPEDPIASRSELTSGCYRYKSEDGGCFKIMANLELDTDLMDNDGGIYSGWYEIYTKGAQSY